MSCGGQEGGGTCIVDRGVGVGIFPGLVVSAGCTDGRNWAFSLHLRRRDLNVHVSEKVDINYARVGWNDYRFLC